jgi:hypothetical protein
MLRRVALVRTDVSEEISAYIIWVTRIGELGTMFPVTSNRRTLHRNINRNTIYLYTACLGNVVPSSPIIVILMMEALRSLKRRFLQEPQGVTLPEDAILHSHRRDNLKFYTFSCLFIYCNSNPM